MVRKVKNVSKFIKFLSHCVCLLTVSVRLMLGLLTASHLSCCVLFPGIRPACFFLDFLRGTYRLAFRGIPRGVGAGEGGATGRCEGGRKWKW